MAFAALAAAQAPASVRSVFDSALATGLANGDTVPLSLIGAVPHIAALNVWNTTFTFVNMSSTEASAGLSLFAEDGSPLTLPLVLPQVSPVSFPASSVDRSLAGNASLIINTAEVRTSPSFQVGSAQLSGSGALDGFAIFHLIPGSQEAVVPLEKRNGSSYLLAFDNTGGVVLGVAVANISSQAATIPVIIRDDAGVVLSAPGTTLSLAGNGHTSFVLSLQYGFTANKRGTVEFDTPPGGPISVLGIRTTPLTTPSGTTLTLTTVPALVDVDTGGGSIAHIATGNGWQTTFVLVNAGASAAQATLKFFATGTGSPLSIPLSFPQSGAGSSAVANSVTRTLAAGASLIVQSLAPASDATPTIGSAQLETNGNVGGFVVFRYNPNGQEAVVPLETRISAKGFVIAFDNTAGTATGVAMNSVASQSVNVPVTIRDDAGNQIGTDSLTLAANGRQRPYSVHTGS